MKFQRRKLAVAMAFALGMSVVVVGIQASAQDIRIDVTGTNIKRVDTETVAPVQIITREEIQRTGQPTIADVLRALPANNGSYGENFTNSFAPGANAIALRGLSQKSTLVLLNGRRVAGYGFAQNISDSFVDLNQIPSSAVERVEILQDGASAIYGSDAIAGVVNIILRQDYRGFEASGTVGWLDGGKNDYRATLTGGFGDLAKDRFNLFGTLDYYKRDLVKLSDTRFGADRDFRNQSGGRNLANLTTGGTFRQLTATNALTNNYRAISGCEATGGTVLTGPQAVAAGLINVTPPTPGVPGGQSAATFATNTAQASPNNTFCSRDFNDTLTAQPETERVGFLGRGTYRISSDFTAYAEVGLSHITTFQIFTPPFFSGTTGLTPTAAGLQPFTYNINFAPGVAGNPFSSNARFLGSYYGVGTRDNEITSDTQRYLVGLKYFVYGWDLDSAASYSRNEVENFNINRLSKTGVSSVFGVSPATQPPIPLSTSSQYNLNDPLSNSAASIAAQIINFSRESTSELFFVDTKASREIPQWKLPGGPVAVALGAEYRDEKLKDTPDPRAQNGDILGQGITATDGKRHSYAVYGELALPILRQLEAQVAVRYDHYSDYGNSTNPKVGLRWNPHETVLFRANWGKGFRAPTLPEISPSIATSFQSVTDPEDQVIRQVSSVSLGNPDLKAERSKSSTVGVVFEPVRNVSFGINAYWIDWKDVVVRPSSQDVLNASCPQGGPGCPSIPGVVVRDPANNNAVVTVFRQYRNQSSVRTHGLDFDGRVTVPTPIGNFTGRTNVAYIDSLKEEGVERAGRNDGTNTIPRIKALFAIDYDYGPWSATARVNHIHHYAQTLLPASFFAVQNPEFQNGIMPSRIPTYTSLDLFGRYVINKQFSISASIINVTDKQPPFDPGFDPTGLYDFQTYSVLGRQYRLTLNYAL